MGLRGVRSPPLKLPNLDTGSDGSPPYYIGSGENIGRRDVHSLTYSAANSSACARPPASSLAYFTPDSI